MQSVLMLSYVFPPRLEAGVFRTIRFVKYLPEFGWRPLVLTGTRESAGWRHDAGLEQQIPQDTVVARTTAWRPGDWLKQSVAAWNPSAQPIAAAEQGPRHDHAEDHGRAEGRRQAGWSSGMYSAAEESAKLFFATPDAEIGWAVPAIRAALRLIRQYKPGVIFSTSPPHSSHLIALAVKSISGLPLVIDYRDPWTNNRLYKNEDGPCRRAVHRQLERLCVSRSDRVILNTRRAMDDYYRSYPPAFHDRFRVIPNGYDPAQLKGIEQQCRQTSSSRVAGAIHLCHPGSIYGRRDLRPLISAIGKLVESGHSVCLDQIGPVVDQAKIESYIIKRGLEKHVQMFGQLSHQETLQRMAAADYFIIVYPTAHAQVPCKLYEMMMFRKPIVALIDEGETANIIRRYALGTIAKPNDSEAIARAIVRVAQDCTNNNFGGGLSEALAAFDGRKLTQDLAALFTSVSRIGAAPATASQM